VFAQAGLDGLVGDAVEDHLANLIPDRLGEATDVASVAVVGVRS
jgi:hypothetical protein